MNIGEKIIELRKKENLTQEELAEKIGVVRQTISKWELNETAPDLAQAKKLAEVFKVSLDEIVGSGKNTTKKKNNYLKYIIIFGIFIVLLLVFVKVYIDKNSDIHDENAVDVWHVNCKLDDKTIEYYIEYYRSDGKIKGIQFPSFMYSVIGASEDEDDANDLIFKTKQYYELNNGVCTDIEEEQK